MVRTEQSCRVLWDHKKIVTIQPHAELTSLGTSNTGIVYRIDDCVLENNDFGKDFRT